MYLCIDVGGTKTLIAVFSAHGKILEQRKFKTPAEYKDFIALLQDEIELLEQKEFTRCVIAIPGRVNRKTGTGLGFGNLTWTNVPIGRNLTTMLGIPVLVENDANVAGVSEARALPASYRRVLYITVSTGIGSGFIVDGNIDPNLADSEAGDMMFEYEGKLQKWEKFASGKAIVARYGKPASQIQSVAIWKTIAHNIAFGLIELIVTIQPDIIIIGGGVGSHFEHFGPYINQELTRYKSNLISIPPVKGAKHAEEAVIYGCYELAKD